MIGLTCNLVGVFFLANSIIFRKLRNVIAVFFGVRMRSLNTIKDYTLNNIQVALGFIFLTLGFLLQGIAMLPEVSDDVETGMQTSMWVICGCILLAAFLIFLVGASYSRHTFKKYLRRFFQEYPEAFNNDIAVTKEIGEFLGIRHTQDMSVEDYLQQVRSALRMPDEAGARPVSKGLGGRKRGLSTMQSRHS